MQKRQIDKKTKQVRIDTKLHKLLKIKAAKERVTMKSLIGEYLTAELVEKKHKIRHPLS